MSFKRRTNFTAMTATIRFDEFDIGGMQEITISENWNLKQLNALGNRSPVAFIPGFFVGEITAKRAFIEKDNLKNIFIHHLRPTLSSDVIDDIRLEDVTVNSADPVDTSLIINSTQFSNSINEFEDILEKWEDLFYTIYFDISIKDENRREIMLLNDCMLESKRTSISQGNIIIMQDITLKFRRFQKKV